ncbi:MAG: peptidoglycan editing factor PgeF [Proteobacteria bacterium]|nr:peptidoglycan editing factor PgeF [Pseudomonadota bacterium]
MISQTNNLWFCADWPAPKQVHAGTTLRVGGHSQAPFNDLNLAHHVGDVSANVYKNRAIIINRLELQSEPICLDQTHSSNVISIDTTPENRKADGSFTTRQNKVCTVMTADCVPVLFCNHSGTKIAAVHAGWRGICRGIIENAIKMFSEPETVLAWIGPCISSDYYEVGKDVYTACLNHSSALKSAFKQSNAGHWHCDLANIVKIILKNAEVGAIYECRLCTYKMDRLFYSYRRDGKTGRMASMIWME